MEGSSFGDVPLNLELKLESGTPELGGIVIDAVRLRNWLLTTASPARSRARVRT